MHVELGSKDLTAHVKSVSMEEITQSEAADLVRPGTLLSLLCRITQCKKKNVQNNATICVFFHVKLLFYCGEYKIVKSKQMNQNLSGHNA